MNRIKESILSMVVSDSFDIRTRNAGVFRFPAAYRYEAHAHCEIEINYINSGSCKGFPYIRIHPRTLEAGYRNCPYEKSTFPLLFQED